MYTEEEIKMLTNCSVCPRNCGIDRIHGQKGFCGLDASLNIASICVHKGEEPVIVGDKGICNVFFSGCNLRCIYCQNDEISRPATVVDNYSMESALDAIEEILSSGVMTVGFVSPSHVVPQVKALLRGIQERGLHPITVYNTNCFDKEETIRDLDGQIDIFLPDLKYVSSEISHDYSSAKNYYDVAMKALKEMYRQKGSTLITDDSDLVTSGLIIRHLVLPGHVDESINVLRKIADELSPGVYLSLMAQYFPTEAVANHPYLNRTLTAEEYEMVVNEMEVLGFRHGWCQELDSSRNYRPDFSSDTPFADR
ncbi:MAG: radical SAM protein [Bacteroidales bacterium]|nr:radical SAM protein [Bacteroidales bacterium]